MVNLREIPNLLLENKLSVLMREGLEKPYMHLCAHDVGYNQALTDQGKREIEINREKLFQVLQNAHPHLVNSMLVDAIKRAEKDLFCVKGGI